MIRKRIDKNMVDEDALDQTEAIQFMSGYLIPEMYRHARMRDEARKNMEQEINETGLNSVLAFTWKIATERHQEDINFTLAGVKKLCKKFNLSLQTFAINERILTWLNEYL
ncbi:MAG: hypothetical protein ACOC80_16530 [Petrotogales bacterium]